MATANIEKDAPEFEEWRSKAKGRPLRILVGGKSGAGKSALINNLLGEKLCEEGGGADAVTRYVKKVSGKLQDFNVEVYDTPGLEDIDERRSHETIVGEISATVEFYSSGRVDLFFYCMPISLGAQRIKQEDVRILRILTLAFGKELWERGIIVLTYANTIGYISEDDYRSRIEVYGHKMKSILTEDIRVDEHIVEKIPVLTAGFTEAVIPLEASAISGGGENWQERLLAAAVHRADPESVPALVEIRFKKSVATIATYGALAGGTTGAGVLAGAALGAQIGMSIGKVIPPGGGLPAGVLIGTIIGAGIAAVLSDGIKFQYRAWREKNKFAKQLAN